MGRPPRRVPQVAARRRGRERQAGPPFREPGRDLQGSRGAAAGVFGCGGVAVRRHARRRRTGRGRGRGGHRGRGGGGTPGGGGAGPGGGGGGGGAPGGGAEAPAADQKKDNVVDADYEIV